MATTKVTITLQDQQLDEIQTLIASKKTASISGFIQHAIKIALRDDAEWQQFIDDALESTGGLLTDSERAWADSIILGTLKRKKSPRTGKAA